MFFETDAVFGILLAFLAANAIFLGMLDPFDMNIAYQDVNKQQEADSLADSLVQHFGKASSQEFLRAAAELVDHNTHITIFGQSFGPEIPMNVSFFVSKRLVFDSNNSSLLEVIVW